MKSNKGQFLIAAAIAGIVGAGMMGSTSAIANDMGKCMGANGCKGQGGCKTASNECKGQNGCKGKGWVEKSKADCDKLAKKNKSVTWESKS